MGGRGRSRWVGVARSISFYGSLAARAALDWGGRPEEGFWESKKEDEVGDSYSGYVDAVWSSESNSLFSQRGAKKCLPGRRICVTSGNDSDAALSGYKSE